MMHAAYWLVAVLAAYWVYNDARPRARDAGTAVMWSAGTLFMPIIFLPLYLILGRRAKPARETKIVDIEAVPVEELIYCPMCGNKVKEDFVACPYCSHTLKPKCRQCGKELNRDWRTCPYCESPADPK